MDIEEFFADLSREGIVLTAAGGRLHVRSQGAVPSYVVQQIAARKDELLAFMAPKPSVISRGHCLVCGRQLSAYPQPGEWLRCAGCGNAGHYAPAQNRLDELLGQLKTESIGANT